MISTSVKNSSDDRDLRPLKVLLEISVIVWSWMKPGFPYWQLLLSIQHVTCYIPTEMFLQHMVLDIWETSDFFELFGPLSMSNRHMARSNVTFVTYRRSLHVTAELIEMRPLMRQLQPDTGLYSEPRYCWFQHTDNQISNLSETIVRHRKQVMKLCWHQILLN